MLKTLNKSLSYLTYALSLIGSALNGLKQGLLVASITQDGELMQYGKAVALGINNPN